MGSNDTAEALAVCHEVNVANEARIAELENELGAAHVARTVFEAQVAELERENVRLESALAERLRHDRHGTAGLEAELRDARARLARIFRLVDPRRDDPAPLPAAVIRRILDDLTADPSIGAPSWETLDASRRLVAALRDTAAAIDLDDLEHRLDEATRTAAEGIA